MTDTIQTFEPSAADILRPGAVEAFTEAAAPARVEPWKVDVSRGFRYGGVNSQWNDRGPEERYTSLAAMHADASALDLASYEEVFDCREVTVETGGPRGVAFRLPGDAEPVDPTFPAFGQLCARIGTDARYVRQLADEPELAAACLRHDLRARGEAGGKLKALVTADGLVRARSFVGPQYGRISDADVIAAVMRVAGDGTGDAPWKVPGCIDWGTSTYNPNVVVDQENTTLFWAPDKLYLFLVDDHRPIRVGTLPNGDPDYVFRGFAATHSETGHGSLRIITLMMRGVCQNRNVWGAEAFGSFSIRHTSGAPERFLAEAYPALVAYAEGSAADMEAGIRQAQSRVLAGTDEEQVGFLVKAMGVSRQQAAEIVAQVMLEEGHPPTTAWDMSNGMTAYARKRFAGNTGTRLEWEEKAGTLLAKAAA